MSTLDLAMLFLLQRYTALQLNQQEITQINSQTLQSIQSQTLSSDKEMCISNVSTSTIIEDQCYPAKMLES
jgi:hypothetical protein